MYVRYYSNDTTAKGSGYGVFIEEDNHNELIKEDGIYKELLKKQASGYNE